MRRLPPSVDWRGATIRSPRFQNMVVGRANAVEAGSSLRAAAAGFLDLVERNLQTFGDDQDARTGEVAKSLAEVDAALGAIVDDLAAMEMGRAA